jgi:hypothetical protein
MIGGGGGSGIILSIESNSPRCLLQFISVFDGHSGCTVLNWTSNLSATHKNQFVRINIDITILGK